MFVADSIEDTSVVAILPGRFHPFHKGHAYMYETLVSQFGRDRVWIATSNKVELPKSPFSYSDKLQMMQLAGVPADRVVETRNMYTVPELTDSFNKENTVIIFAVSDKDMAEDPRFSFKPKKDGSSSYLQPLPRDLKNAETMDKHGYISAIKTLNFTVLGEPMRSATEVRSLYAKSNDETRKSLIKDLFGGYNNEVKAIMDAKLQINEKVGDTWNVGDKFLVNTDDPKNKKLTVDKIKGNKLLGSDTKWYSKYGVTKEGLNAIPEDIYLEEDWKKTLAAAAVAVGTSTAPMPAQADADILSAITKLTRAFGSIQRITPNSVKGDIKGEIGNQARRGDASSQNLTIQNRGKTQVSKFNKWDGKLGNQESIETEAVFTPDDTIVTDIMTKLASLVKRPAGQSMIGRMFSKKPEQPTEVEIKFPTGRMSVDKFTAKAVLDAYAKINPKNQGNMDQLLGTKQGFSQIVDKLTKDGKIREGVDINVVLGQIILESKINEYGVGIITKQNSTPDVKPGETQRQAAKFGNKLNKKGLPPMVNEQIKTINKIGEELYQIDRDDPMLKSQVLVPGVGRMNIDSLHKNLAEKFLDLADKMKAMSPEQAEQANYLLQKSPLRVMLNALSDAYAELENVRRKGGRNSRGIGA